MFTFLQLAENLSPWQIEDPKIIFSMLIGFALLLFVVLRLPVPFLSVPHYRKVLDERSSRIATNKEQIDTAISEVQTLRRDYAARLEKIEEEAKSRIDAAVREADAARAEIIAEAEQAAQALRRRSEEEIARERTRQRILFRRQLVMAALDSAESAIKANTGDDAQRRLIADFIGRAGAQASNGATSKGDA